MAKYKIYIKKDVDQYDLFYSHYAQKQGVIATQLGPYGSGKIYIGKANEGNYDPINNSTVNRMKTLDVNLHMSKPSNPIDVINIKNQLPSGVQALMNNPYNQPFSYIGDGLVNGSTRFGRFTG